MYVFYLTKFIVKPPSFHSYKDIYKLISDCNYNYKTPLFNFSIVYFYLNVFHFKKYKSLKFENIFLQ